MLIIGHRPAIGLQTRLKSDIENAIDRDEPTPGIMAEMESYKRKHFSATHRPGGPSTIYNCHGLTFASRRTQIWKPSEIQKILKEDDYQEISVHQTMAGDVVVYFDERNDAVHSGVVVESTPMLGNLRIIKVLSKWGAAHEAIHAPADCPYRPATLKYYRIEK
jgi:hypothetical protein